MKIKNYIVTHIETGSTSRHAGISPTRLTAGEISSETIANGYYTPPMEWNPDINQWKVEEAKASQ